MTRPFENLRAWVHWKQKEAALLDGEKDFANAIAKLLEALDLATDELNRCVDDRHYHGSYPRHEEVLKKIKELGK